MKKEVHKKKNLTPNEFSNLLSCVELKKLGFLEIRSHLYPENLENASIDISTTNSVKVSFVDKENLLAATDVYQISATVKNKKIFEIYIKVLALFDCSHKVDNMFIELFKKNTLKLIVYPYVRETVHDLTTKMGIQPLLLPMWRVPHEAKKDFLKASVKPAAKLKV